MGWTSPATWVAGTVVTADDMNTNIRDQFSYFKGIGQVPTIQSGLTIDNSLGSERLLLPLLSTAECTTVLNAEGEVAFDEQTHQMKEYDGTAVRVLISEADVDDTPVNGVTTFPVSSNWAYDHLNTLTTAGDLPYATAAGTWDRLGVGTALQLLRTNSGATAPEWATVGGIQIVSSTYTGADGDNRQITTGFACKLVIVYTTAGDDWLWVCCSQTASYKLSGTPAFTAGAIDVLLHATDGFVVDQENANHNGETYRYCALG